MDLPTITDGAVLFRRYLNRHETNIPLFCAKHGIDRVRTQRAMSRHSVSAEFATLIQRATNGEVPASAWGERTMGATAADAAVTRRKRKAA
jgi:hypothetical protein